MAQFNDFCGAQRDAKGGVTEAPEYCAVNPLKGLLKDKGKGTVLTPSRMVKNYFTVALETHYDCLALIRQNCNMQATNPYINLSVRLFRNHARVAVLSWRLKAGVGQMLQLPERSTVNLFSESGQAVKVRRLLRSKTPGSFAQIMAWEYVRESAALRSRQLFDVYHAWNNLSANLEQRWDPEIETSIAQQGRELCWQYNLPQLRLFKTGACE